MKPKPTGHISTAEIYAGAGVPFGQSLRRCADALKRLNDATTEHLDYEREVAEPDELLDEPGPQIESFWGCDRRV